MQTHEIVRAERERRESRFSRKRRSSPTRATRSGARRALPWEPVDKDVRIRRARRRGNAGRSLRRALAARRLPLHVRARLGDRMQAAARSGPTTSTASAPTWSSATSHASPISRAPLAKLKAFEQRMGWSLQVGVVGQKRLQLRLPRVVSPGRPERATRRVQLRAHRDETDRPPRYQRVLQGRQVGRSSTRTRRLARGLDMLNAAYNYLDIVPKGRDEDGLPSAQAWVRSRDQYGAR